jgi:hypothetical protein
VPAAAVAQQRAARQAGGCHNSSEARCVCVLASLSPAFVAAAGHIKPGIRYPGVNFRVNVYPEDVLPWQTRPFEVCVGL